MNSLSDIELWAFVRQDNAIAFEVLYNRHWEKFYTLCYWNLLDQEAAKDLVQELFVDLWIKREQINITDTVEGYLKIAIRNRTLNHIRSQQTKRKHLDAISRDRKEEGLVTYGHDGSRELKELYHAEIGKLPSRMKNVYLMIKQDGLSISEAAKRLSLSEQTVKNQLGSALKRIRSGLEYYKLTLVLILFYLTVILNDIVLSLI